MPAFLNHRTCKAHSSQCIKVTCPLGQVLDPVCPPLTFTLTEPQPTNAQSPSHNSQPPKQEIKLDVATHTLSHLLSPVHSCCHTHSVSLSHTHTEYLHIFTVVNIFCCPNQPPPPPPLTVLTTVFYCYKNKNIHLCCSTVYIMWPQSPRLPPLTFSFSTD